MCPLCHAEHSLSKCPRWKQRGVGEFALVAALAWAGSVAAVGWWAYGQGQDKVIAEHAEQEAQRISAEAAERDRLAKEQRKKDDAYEARIRSLNRQLADALERVSDRPDRLPEPARAACQGATGAELSARDSAFLIRLAGRADELRAALERCQGGGDEAQ